MPLVCPPIIKIRHRPLAISNWIFLVFMADIPRIWLVTAPDAALRSETLAKSDHVVEITIPRL
jgi:hypothetical protein